MAGGGATNVTVASSVALGSSGFNAPGLSAGVHTSRPGLVAALGEAYNQVGMVGEIGEVPGGKFGIHGGPGIIMGLGYTASSLGIANYCYQARGPSPAGFILHTWVGNLTDGTAHIPDSQTNQYIRIQPGQSGSVTILEDGDGDETTGIFNVGSDYHATFNAGTINSSTYWKGDLYIVGDLSYTSDERLKTNVETITGSLATVNSLRGVTFDWNKEATGVSASISESVKDTIKNRKDGKYFGLIAQEVEQVAPSVVKGRGDDYIEISGSMEPVFKGITYDQLVPVLIESVKELSSQVETLKAQITGSGNFDALKSSVSG